jgi:hypothetical protein
MRNWHYDRGKWAQIPSPFDADAELAQELEFLGFGETPILSLGTQPGSEPRSMLTTRRA